MRWIALVVVLVGAWSAHALQARLDPDRRARADDHQLMILPDGPALRAAVLGYGSLAADLLWVRAVLVYGGLGHDVSKPREVQWLARMITAVTDLDPRWRTPYFYGATLLRTAGGIDDSDAVLLRAMEALPDDSYFPFALGMNHYMVRDDAQEASRWLKKAAKIPGAPDWYELAARGLVVKKSGLETSIRYVEAELAATSDPGLRENLTARLASLKHDRWVEELETARAHVEGQLGRPLTSLQELVTLGAAAALPPDPLGGEWMINADGQVLSTVAEDAFVARQLRWERGVLTRVIR